ncbi:MAG: hypothetical protein AABY32_04015 [Nanoarchaeota archaeon]
MKKVFENTIEIVMYTYAENYDEAQELAYGHVQDEVCNYYVNDFSCKEIKTLKQADSSWHDSIPYGCDEDKTVKQLLENTKETAEEKMKKIQELRDKTMGNLFEINKS